MFGRPMGAAVIAAALLVLQAAPTQADSPLPFFTGTRDSIDTTGALHVEFTEVNLSSTSESVFASTQSVIDWQCVDASGAVSLQGSLSAFLRGGATFVVGLSTAYLPGQGNVLLVQQNGFKLSDFHLQYSPGMFGYPCSPGTTFRAWRVSYLQVTVTGQAGDTAALPDVSRVLVTLP